MSAAPVIHVRIRGYRYLLLVVRVLARANHYGVISQREAMQACGWIASQWPMVVDG